MKRCVNGVFALASALAGPALAQEGPGTFHLAPADQRLTPMRVFEHALPPFKLVFAVLLLATAAAVVVWGVEQLRRGRGEEVSQGALRFLSAAATASPLAGAAVAAYGLMNACIGIANIRPEPSAAVLAPAFAEALLALFLGFLAATMAALLGGHLRSARRSPEPAVS